MNQEYYIEGIKVDWKILTLKKYLDVYTPQGWEEVFEAAKESLEKVSKHLQIHAKLNVIYPPMPYVFNSMDSLQPEQIRVVIIGQDPYIKEGEAMGWSFSVPQGLPVPPSLRNIYNELTAEGYTGYKSRKTGDLSAWVDKGVFLYNACMTVNAMHSGSHGSIWSEFTNMVICYLNQHDHIAWILLGAKAHAYAKRLDTERHGVFKAGHPSPINRSGGFKGSEVFAKAERYLQKCGHDFTWNL